MIRSFPLMVLCSLPVQWIYWTFFISLFLIFLQLKILGVGISYSVLRLFLMPIFCKRCVSIPGCIPNFSFLGSGRCGSSDIFPDVYIREPFLSSGPSFGLSEPSFCEYLENELIYRGSLSSNIHTLYFVHAGSSCW